MRRIRLNVRPGASAAELLAAARLSQLQGDRQRIGQEGEDRVAAALLARGLRLVEKVEVPMGITSDGRRFGKRTVSGDYRAVDPVMGRSVLVEVKNIPDRLSWSDFRKHQPGALDEHQSARGITEVAWIDRGTLRFIPWERFRALGFGPRLSVAWNHFTNDIEIHKPIRIARERNVECPRIG